MEVNILETIQAIHTRRSIRSFTEEEISTGDIEILLKAAMQAPSARNTQSWQFVVTTERQNLDQISEVHPYAAMSKEARLGILVCGDLELEPSLEYNALNCSAATQNILLAAHDIQLGGVWIGIHPRQERKNAMRSLFELPENIEPISLVLLGHPTVQATPANRFKKERIHFEKWSRKE